MKQYTAKKFSKQPNFNIKQIFNTFAVLFILFIATLLLDTFSNIYLACGLFGFLGSNPIKYYNKSNFNVLGVFNDSRGGDGCGVISAEYYDIYTKNKYHTTFKQAIIDKEFNVPSKIEYGILGHTRKASVGGINDIYTQPCVFVKSDPIVQERAAKDPKYKEFLDNNNDNSIVFAGTHNGTIHNYKELAKKHGIDTTKTNMNDTQVLYEILFKKDYNVLSEYIGAASLMFYDFYEGTISVFRGESSISEHVKYDEEERPLFMWRIAKDNYYFSSIKDSLLFIGAEENEVSIFPKNLLSEYNQGCLVQTTVIDRSNAFQRESYATTSYPNNSDRLPFALSGGGNSYNQNSKEYDRIKNAEYLVKGATIINWNFEKAIHVTDPKKIMYIKGRYWINEGLAHGVYPITTWGIIPSEIYTQYKRPIKLYYFVEGIMIEELNDYIDAMSYYIESLEILLNKGRKEKGTYYYGNYYSEYNLPVLVKDIIEFEADILDYIMAFAAAPFQSLFKLLPTGYIKDPNTTGRTAFYSGTVKAPFAKRNYEVMSGNLQKIASDFDAGTVMHMNSDNTEATMYIKEYEKLFEDFSKLGYSVNNYDLIGQYLLGQSSLDDIDTSDFDSFFTKILKNEIGVDVSKDSDEIIRKVKALYDRTFDYAETRQTI